MAKGDGMFASRARAWGKALASVKGWPALGTIWCSWSRLYDVRDVIVVLLHVGTIEYGVGELPSVEGDVSCRS